MTLSVALEGLNCGSCVRRAEAAIAKVPGVEKASVSLATRRADVALADGADRGTVLAALDESLAAAGYPVAARKLEIAVEGMNCASCGCAMCAHPDAIFAGVVPDPSSDTATGLPLSLPCQNSLFPVVFACFSYSLNSFLERFSFSLYFISFMRLTRLRSVYGFWL